MTLFELQAKLGLDTSEYEQGIAKAKKEVTGMMEVFKGSFLADLAHQGLNYAVSMGKQAISLASDLEEVQNVVDVTFGDGAGKIESWSKSAKNAFGMGELSAKKYAGTMGAMLKSMGMTDAEVLNMSTSLVQLAGDMASFYNLDHDTAFEKIRAGISGETEPLKQLGINMSVANLEAYAMSQGIDKAYASMTQAEQAALRYNYILEATTGAQGDFTRTAEGYANQLRLFQENVESILTAAGGKLVSFINPILTELNKALDKASKTTVEQELKNIETEEARVLAEAETKQARAFAMIDVLEDLEGQVEMTEKDTDIWQNTLERLVQLFPELSSQIDLETGKIKTNTDALRENVRAATENARDKARVAALQKRQDVLQAAYVKEIEAETEYRILEAQLRTYEEDITKIIRSHPDYKNATDYEIDSLIYGELASKQGRKWFYDEFGSYAKKYGTTDFYDDLVLEQFAKVTRAGGTERKEGYFHIQEQLLGAEAELKKAQRETELAVKEYEDADNALREMGVEIEAVAEATRTAATAEEDYIAALEKSVAAFATMEEAYKAVYEYRESVYSDMRESLRNGTNDLWGLVADMTEADIEGSGEVVKQNMLANEKFYAEYAKNLQLAKEKGIDANLLNELAQEHSAENAALLKYIVGGGDVSELNAAWETLQTAKNELSTTMAESALEVDGAYKAMIESAEKAVEAFELEETARQNAASTAEGVVQGLESKIPDIQARVDQINAIMDSIGHANLYWSEDGDGSFSLGRIFGGIGGFAGEIESAMYNGAFGGIRAGLAGQKVGVELGGMLPNINAGLMGLAVAGRYG